jgi:hypothetical protein
MLPLAVTESSHTVTVHAGGMMSVNRSLEETLPTPVGR